MRLLAPERPEPGLPSSPIRSPIFWNSRIPKPRVVPAGETGLYGISLQSLTNVDTPYVYFEFGAPEMGENARVYGLPYVTYSSNVGGNPDGARTDVPWSSLDSEVNTVGFMLAPGYALDVNAGGYVGLSFSVTTYPGLKALLDRDAAAIRTALEDARAFWSVDHRERLITTLAALASTPDTAAALRAQIDESLATLTLALADATAQEAVGINAVIEVLHGLQADPDTELPDKCLPLFAPFRFNVYATATAMTREEFVARQTQDALAMRDRILADPTASVALVNLAADGEAWLAAYMAALHKAQADVKAEHEEQPRQERMGRHAVRTVRG